MRKVFWSRQSAAKAMLSCMEDYKPLWEHNQHIVASVAGIRSLTGDIDAAARRQGDNSTPGYTADKNGSLEAVLEGGFDLCKKMKVFARHTSNAVLLAQTDYTASTFDDGTEEEQVERCARMARLAQENLRALDTYEVTEGAIAALNALIETVRPKEAQRDAVGARRTQATATIPELMKQLTGRLQDLDDDIEAFMTKPEQQEFRETYFVARRVKDYKGKAKKTGATA
ncbi:MAG: hypothetical protein EOO11_22965 [Chitinophagaceae bacterium]|nr:MAG: hypothetical protein EOO11_22965 [Chitinophagaceae bacterium]